MKIKKLNEWKCGMDIDDADIYVEPTGALKDMIEHFGLKYNPRIGCYDCDGDVDLYEYCSELSNDEREDFDNEFVRNGKMTIWFGEVKGNFILPGMEKNGYILTSLIGCPQNVGGGFSCSYNQLTSLEGCPKTVGGYFGCSHNRLTSLEGCPEIVGGGFGCSYNQLTSLKGCPKTVGGYFGCSHNQLTSLDGCPENIGGHFDCYSNRLTSLKGCPEKVDGSFDCNDNQLTSLEGCPKSVGGDFYCNCNKTEFTTKDVTAVCDVNGNIFL